MNDSITLFSFANIDRSSRVRWLLEEMTIPFSEYRLNYTEQENKGEDYRKINPFGLVPGLTIGDSSMFESVAIMSYLLEQHPESELAPSPGTPERGAYLQWMFFAASTLDALVGNLFFLKRTPENAEKRQAAYEKLKPHLAALSARLAGNNYILGEKFRAPDIVIGQLLGLLQRDEALGDFPVLTRYLDTLGKRKSAVASGVFTSQIPTGV